MGFNIKAVRDSFIHTEIRGSVSVVNTSDLYAVLDLARRTVVSEDALFEANVRIKELEGELSQLRGRLADTSSSDIVLTSTTNVNVDVQINQTNHTTIVENVINEDENVVNEDTIEDDDNGFESGKQKYREQGCINKVRIISLAINRVKPADIVNLVLKSESPKRKYTKAYISSVYSPKTVNELDDLVTMCSNYSDYLEGVSLESVKTFLYARYTRKIKRKEG